MQEESNIYSLCCENVQHQMYVGKGHGGVNQYIMSVLVSGGASVIFDLFPFFLSVALFLSC